MTGFSIELSKDVHASEEDLVSVGKIYLGDFTEAFEASLSYWDRSKYLSQWQEALIRLVNHEDKTALITTMYDPQEANFIFWWVMYLVGEKVCVQNHVLFIDDLEGGFDKENPYKHIPEREIYDEDGELVSEWVVKLDDIEACLKML